MLSMRAMGITALMSLLLAGSASAETGAIDTSDNVAISFWIATAMMLASTIFFLVERNNVAPKWRTSVTVAALVALVTVTPAMTVLRAVPPTVIEPASKFESNRTSPVTVNSPETSIPPELTLNFFVLLINVLTSFDVSNLIYY